MKAQKSPKAKTGPCKSKPGQCLDSLKYDPDDEIDDTGGGDKPQSHKSKGPNPTLLAAKFIKRYSSKIKELQGRRAIHFFNGGYYLWDRVWKEVSLDEIKGLVSQFLQNKTAVETVLTSLVTNVLTNLQGQCLVMQGKEPLPFFIDKYEPPTTILRKNILVFQNGLLDLSKISSGSKPKIRPFDSRWFGMSILPFSYNEKAKCPKFKAFLRHIFEHNPETGEPTTVGDQRIRVLQEWFGYTLLCDGRFQKFLLMLGEGSNGKGVIQQLWIRMLGESNVAHVGLDQLSERFSLQPLMGKLANICGDLCEIDGTAEGVLKRLTGQDNITVDRKYLSPITMSPAVKLVFATNVLPRFADKSEGVWRRLMVLPFRLVISEAEQNKNLVAELSEELPGILNWGICGLQRLLKNGHFSACSVCHQAAQEHRTDCDPVAQFLDDEFTYPSSSDATPKSITVGALHQRYSDWCDKSGHKRLALNRFNRQIAKLPGIHKHREATGKRPYYWTGIGNPLTSPPKEDDEED